MVSDENPNHRRFEAIFTLVCLGTPPAVLLAAFAGHFLGFDAGRLVLGILVLALIGLVFA